jgi:GSCFA family/Polysaccharide biosynthesis enzyme WcbI
MQDKQISPVDFQFLLDTFGGELIDAAYAGILERAPDPEGRVAHKAFLQNTRDLSATLRSIVHSAEFAEKMRDMIAERVKLSMRLDNNKPGGIRPPGKKFLLLGNCQTRALARLIPSLVAGAEAIEIHYTPQLLEKLSYRDEHLSKLIEESTLILSHPHDDLLELLRQNFPSASAKIRLFPRIFFAAFHPDAEYVADSHGIQLFGPMSAYHSSIAFFAWTHHLSKAETLRLFCEDTYSKLGYFDYWPLSVQVLVEEGARADISMEPLIEKWTRQGCWMYSMNHPKLFVLADIARIVLTRAGLDVLPGVEEYAYDELKNDYVWPLYPEIGKRLNLEGHYLFKRAAPREVFDVSVPMMALEEFIEASFEAFSKYPANELTGQRSKSDWHEKLLAKAGNQAPASNMVESTDIIVPASKPANLVSTNAPNQNPYLHLPDYQFWRRAVERLPVADVNPVVNARFSLSRESKVATAGSCFAQHISRTLSKHGFNYYVTETADHIAQQEATKRNFGIFSARFGNLYSARQLVQLFDRAYGHFLPSEQAWIRPDGKLVDPFRPQIEPDGFDSIDALEQSRAAHFVAVREMFESLDIFVFTLGLTEAWLSRADGAVFALAPGVVAGEMDFERYEFFNFNVSDVVADLQLFIDKLKAVNPNAKIIFTVSPVPLIATYENQHVLVATTYSKSVLRAAAGEITKANQHCDYFPSYEIITGNYNKGKHFEDDLRSIRPEGVDHVMRLFLSGYANHTLAHNEISASQQEILNEMSIANSVVCEEEAIDAIRP